MMTKKPLLSVGVAVIGSMLFSCSPDEEINTNSSVGKHSIEVSFDGDISDLSPSVFFQGWRMDGSHTKVYGVGGRAMEDTYVFDYDDGEFDKVMAYTAGECNRFGATIILLNASGVSKTINIRCKGYVNDQLKKVESKTITFSKEILTASLYFDSMDGLSQ